MGFFSKEDLHIAWDSQKVHVGPDDRGTDNLLDYGKAALSIANPIKVQEVAVNK